MTSTDPETGIKAGGGRGEVVVFFGSDKDGDNLEMHIRGTARIRGCCGGGQVQPRVIQSERDRRGLCLHVCPLLLCLRKTVEDSK